MTSQQFDKAQFDRTANDKHLWRMRAADLHLASSILREKLLSLSAGGFDPEKDFQGALNVLTHCGIIAQAAMLQGFAIEAYLKAYWLQSGRKLATDGKYRISTLKRDNHDLAAIADAVGFALSKSEREVLSRLSLFVSSYGRYPITKKWHQNPLRKDEQGVLTRLPWNDTDHAISELLIGKLRDETK